MGKGDKKTKRGKIAKGTFGVSRPRPSASVEPKKEAPAKKKAKSKK
ncbi:30S ribosomal protein THX [Fulvivirga sedimenti]|uniref:30S ribosomal protein THX n=1 Tax=Fulvivirga sedimenti TaxID=2879465 RepID=A0A9X1HK04_9BACT|nr:30S ribosomal protein THX [Fulvivirga sedimenti]MCA6073584.1 30S ribosomal protein THX [Fulvivirga sedimenti]